MAKRKVAGPGRLGSIEAAKKSVKSGRKSIAKTIPKEGSIMVRFLGEPKDAHGFYQHFNEDDGYFPCWGGECCQISDSRAMRYLANAFVYDDNAVHPVLLTQTIFDQLLNYYEKNGTIMDRDYDLSRSGSGFDTKYFAQPDSPRRVNVKRYESKKHDLDDVLQQMLDAYGDEEPEEETPRRRTKPRRTTDRDVWHDDEDDDDEYDDDEYDDDEEEDEDDEPPRRTKKRSTASKKSATKKKGRSYTKSGMDEFDRKTTRNPSKKTSKTRRSSVKRTRR